MPGLIVIVGAVASHVLGWATLITFVINVLWLLFKDHTAFSWWIVVGLAVAFVVSLITTLVAIFTR